MIILKNGHRVDQECVHLHNLHFLHSSPLFINMIDSKTYNFSTFKTISCRFESILLGKISNYICGRTDRFFSMEVQFKNGGIIN